MLHATLSQEDPRSLGIKAPSTLGQLKDRAIAEPRGRWRASTGGLNPDPEQLRTSRILAQSQNPGSSTQNLSTHEALPRRRPGVGNSRLVHLAADPGPNAQVKRRRLGDSSNDATRANLYLDANPMHSHGRQLYEAFECTPPETKQPEDATNLLTATRGTRRVKPSHDGWLPGLKLVYSVMQATAAKKSKIERSVSA